MHDSPLHVQSHEITYFLSKPVAYPDLAALMGARVPDLRGLFLRGQGGNSAALGVTQIDTMRPITGGPFEAARASGGAIYSSGSGHGDQGRNNYNWTNVYIDSSRLGPHFSGQETRPVNMAVRYLVKAQR